MLKTSRPRRAILFLAALGLLTAILPTGSSQVVEIHGDTALGEDGCGAIEDSSVQEILREADWKVTEPTGGPAYASKAFTVAFQQSSEQLIELDRPGDPEVGVEECSSGVCSIIVHIYEESTTSVKAHSGWFGFLPWAYAKATVTQEVEVKKESEISCSGEAFVVLTGSGGTGPRSFTASMWKDEATQVYQQCHYLNIPSVDESCNLIFSKDFEVGARTPGEYIRFDVVNGGGLSNRLSTGAANGLVDVAATPAVEIGPYIDQPAFLKASGEWRTTYSGIEIDVDTEEGTDALMEAIGASEE